MSLRLDGVEIRRGRRAILDRVSVELRPGELTAVLGPNGAGKSTLLRVLAGELETDAGAASLDGRSLSSWPPLALARRRAVLPQLSGLAFPFTVEEVVRLGRHPHGDADAPAGRAAAERALAAFDLEGLAGAAYPQLSGGERQRTHAARVMAQVDGAQVDLGGPPWLLLDEPTSALDLAHRHRLLARVARFVGAGGGAVLALHDLNLAARHAERVLLLERGRLVADGPTEEVMTVERLGRLYGVEVERLSLSGRPPVFLTDERASAPEPELRGGGDRPDA